MVDLNNVGARVAAISDEPLKSALMMSGSFGQAAVCGLNADWVAGVMNTHLALVSVLSNHDPKILRLREEIIEAGAEAQRNQRGAPCSEVEKAIRTMEASFKTHGLTS